MDICLYQRKRLLRETQRNQQSNKHAKIVITYNINLLNNTLLKDYVKCDQNYAFTKIYEFDNIASIMLFLTKCTFIFLKYVVYKNCL